MVGNALVCGQCGAGLPPADAQGRSVCVYCGAIHGPTEPNETASAAPVGTRGWLDSGDPARIPLTEEAVLALLRQHFDGMNSILLCPHVPPSRDRAVRCCYADHLPPNERVLALHDTPHSDGEHDGFIVTATRVCWRNPEEAPRSREWRSVDPGILFVEGTGLYVGDDEAIVIDDPDILDAIANAFHVLAFSGAPPSSTTLLRVKPEEPELGATTKKRTTNPRTAKAKQKGGEHRSATIPPPCATSYVAYASHARTTGPDCSCWRCHTPLYDTTPQCAYCGAEPMSTGWLRTG